MKSEAQQFIEYWEREKAKGALSFMLKTGARWTLLFFLMLSVLKLADQSFHESFLSQAALLRLVSCLFAGALYGIVRYFLMEFSYKRYLKKRGGEA